MVVRTSRPFSAKHTFYPLAPDSWYSLLVGRHGLREQSSVFRGLRIIVKRLMRPAFWWLSLVTLFLVAYQARSSMATIEASQTFLFVPFRVKPFTNVIDSVATAARQGEFGVRRGDELLAVNGRPFVGHAVLSQELRRARYLSVTVRSDGRERTTPVYFANCTCGTLSVKQVIWYSLLPSAFCVLIGIVVAVRDPRYPETWAFLGLMLCLSLIQVVPFSFNDWGLAADPMEWRDWFRIPALAYQSFFTLSWPGWLLLCASYSIQPLNNR